MADKLLTTISILENFPTGHFGKGSTIRTYFDTVSKGLEVTITAGGGTYPLLESGATSLPLPSEIIKGKFNKFTGEFEEETTIVNYWSRTQTGFPYSEVIREETTSAEGIRLVYSFTQTRNYPYMTKVTSTVSIPRLTEEPPPNDLSISVVSRTLASGPAVNDGAVEISASGTNTPFTYYKTNPESGGTPNGSGVFTGLYPGRHNFFVKDSAGFQKRILLRVKYKEVPNINANNNIIDNYGVRWRHEQLTLDGEVFKTDIFERDYTGAVSEVKGADTPFSLSRRIEGESFVDMYILYTSCQINFVLETENQFRDIVLGDDKKYIVLRSKYNGSTYDTQWKGFVTPESYQDVLFQPPYYVSIEASDRLGDLKYQDFRYGEDEVVTGFLSQLQILSICLHGKILFDNKYRIACNIFASGQSTSARTPLDQTYVDVSKYKTENGVMNCEEVVLDILKSYQAVLFCEGDYWYVVRKEELINETINYVEYNVDLTVNGTGSWSPRVEIKSPTESNRAVWINGAQSRVYTPPYSNIQLNIETGLVERQSITVEYDVFDQVYSGGFFQGFGSWILYSIDDTVDVNRPKSINNGEDIAWEIGIQASMNSSTYISHSGTINYDGGDQVTIKTEMEVFGYYTSDSVFGQPKINEYPPYLQFKWSLKVGDKWASAVGDYSTEENINYSFFQRTDDFYLFERSIGMPEGDSVSDSYELRIYAVDISEGDVNTNNAEAMISIIGGSSFKVKDVRKLGDRIVGRAGNDFYYYELAGAESRVTNSVDKIMAYSFSPTTNPRAWVLVKTVNLPYQGISEGFPTREYCVDGSCNIVRNGLVTTTIFKQIDLIIEPVGGAVSKELIIERVSNENNNINRTFNISSFDLGNLNKSLYTNYLRSANGVPTKNWTPTGGITTSIQNHVIRFLSKYSRIPRSRVSGNFRTDGVNFTLLNVLLDTSDGSKLYISTGLSSDDKLQEFSGELLEIASGDDVTISAFSNAFKQDQIR